SKLNPASRKGRQECCHSGWTELRKRPLECSAMVNGLRRLGSSKAELIVTANKGSGNPRISGIPIPGASSIMRSCWDGCWGRNKGRLFNSTIDNFTELHCRQTAMKFEKHL